MKKNICTGMGLFVWEISFLLYGVTTKVENKGANRHDSGYLSQQIHNKKYVLLDIYWICAGAPERLLHRSQDPAPRQSNNITGD
jgi:hypothetical protein